MLSVIFVSTTVPKRGERYEATRLHFDHLVKRYENTIIILNLMKHSDVIPGAYGSVRGPVEHRRGIVTTHSPLNCTSRQLLSQLDALLPSETAVHQQRRIEGSEQKKKRMKVDSDVPRGLRQPVSMTSHLESHTYLKGEQVAARDTQVDAGKDEWFVVKVIHFDKETKKQLVSKGMLGSRKMHRGLLRRMCSILGSSTSL